MSGFSRLLQFVACDEVPAEFLPKQQRLDELVESGVLVIEKPKPRPQPSVVERPHRESLLSKFPSLARIYRGWELRLPGDD